MRGKKKFELYAPSCVEDMYVAGTPTRVHANGRICYEVPRLFSAGGMKPAKTARRCRLGRSA